MKGFITALLLTTALYACKDHPNLSKEVSRISHDMAIDNRVTSQRLGDVGLRSEQWSRYDTLAQIANDTELIVLTDNENPAVRSYAFQAILQRPHIDAFPILLRHLSDTVEVKTHYGCKPGNEQVANIFLEAMNTSQKDSTTYHLNKEQKTALDSVIVFNKNHKLWAREEILFHLPAESKYYSRLREMVTIEDNMAAIIALAKYQKKEDKPLIATLLKRENFRSLHYGLAAVLNFPDPGFWPILNHIAENELQKNCEIDYWTMDMLCDAIVQYKDLPSRVLLDKLVTRSKKEKVLFHASHICRSLIKYPDPIYNSLIDRLNKIQQEANKQ